MSGTHSIPKVAIFISTALKGARSTLKGIFDYAAAHGPWFCLFAEGRPKEQLLELAKGGVGAVITGFTSVSSTDFYMDDMMRLSRDELIGQYRCLTDLIHAQGIPVINQLALGAYYRPLPNGRYRQTEPDDMTPEEIRLVIDWFGEAAGAEEEAVMPQRSPIRCMEACSNPYSMNSSLAVARTFPWLAVLSRGTAVPSFRISIL